MTSCNPRSLLFSALLAAGAASCEGKPRNDDTAVVSSALSNASSSALAPAARTAAAGASPAAQHSTPKLVVAIVVDQLATTELLRNESLFDPRGALGRAVREGTLYESARYPYAATLTAPGHASLFTGVPPAKHGVSANEVWDYAAKTTRSATFDPRSVVLGFPGNAGPAALRAETVAEALMEHSRGRAKAVAFSLKERGAIFPLGRAGLALWYEPDDGSFTTSTAYASELPSWLVDAQAKAPIADLLVPWTPLFPERYAALQGPDDQPWESELGGYGRRFPHDPKATSIPLSTLRYSPDLSDRVLALGRAAVEGEGLGSDDTPDLLVLSLSGLDYTGHAYGPRSWEYTDHLLRVDRGVGAFLDWLEARGTVTMALSADHGITPIPESITDGPPTPGRVFTATLVTGLEAHLGKQFRGGPWVESCLGAFLYLSEAAKRRNDVLNATEKWLAGVPGLVRAFRIATFGTNAAAADELEARVRLSVGGDVAADFYLVQAPHTVLDGGTPPGVGTHHGSPYPYDTDVPVLLWGHGIERRRVHEPVDPFRFAATLSELLGVTAPEGALQPSLL
jgi:predicted AlkP superfamily pyrophosphatase or phosphodiesterase